MWQLVFKPESAPKSRIYKFNLTYQLQLPTPGFRS